MNPSYHLVIRLYGFALRVASLFVPKARLWVRGRKQWKAKLKEAVGERKNWTWFHCASLGEFEQGRPLIEAFRRQFPEELILLTFFSPSGYEIRKHYSQVDLVIYLPLDTPSNARFFLDTLQPKQAFFVKYELWLNYLAGLRARKIPHYLVSALLRPDSRFLKSALKKQYATAFRGFNRIFAQDEATMELLRGIVEQDQLMLSGDTRFDRAAELPEQFYEVEGIADFIQGRPCLVVGSSYVADEDLLFSALENLKEFDLCVRLAPHEIDRDRIAQQMKESSGKMGTYSRLEALKGSENVLWIDNVGMLNRLYHYGLIAYIGGGFGKGIHNTQEPATYGNPILFGPKYKNFEEAVEMVEMGTAVAVQNASQLTRQLREWLSNPVRLEELRAQNRAYIQGKAGATRLIMRTLFSGQ